MKATTTSAVDTGPRVMQWMLLDTEHGVTRRAVPAGVPAIEQISELYQRQLAGATPPVNDWRDAYTAAHSAHFDLVFGSDSEFEAAIEVSSSVRWSPAHAALNAAECAIHAAEAGMRSATGDPGAADAAIRWAMTSWRYSRCTGTDAVLAADRETEAGWPTSATDWPVEYQPHD